MIADDDRLPSLDDTRLAAIEERVFQGIGADRARRARRRRVWTTGGAAVAVVVVVAAAITPSIVAGLQPTGVTSAALAPAAPETAIRPGAGAADQSIEGSVQALGSPLARDTVATATASITVDSPRDAAATIGAAARARGGFVESVSLADSSSSSSSPGRVEPMLYPAGDSITVRVPAAELAVAVEELATVGDVTSSTVASYDVTADAADLRARVSAQEASVARLTELVAGAATTADLIAAESALAARQAELDADRQQLTRIEQEVALAALTVQLTPHATVATSHPAGFADGLLSGWNGLVATANALTVGLGFLLPWIAVVAVLGAVVWVGSALARRRRRGRLHDS